MLSIATAAALVIAGVTCIVRDGRVNGRSHVTVRAAAERIELERMFALPARLPQ